MESNDEVIAPKPVWRVKTSSSIASWIRLFDKNDSSSKWSKHFYFKNFYVVQFNVFRNSKGSTEGTFSSKEQNTAFKKIKNLNISNRYAHNCIFTCSKTICKYTSKLRKLGPVMPSWISYSVLNPSFHYSIFLNINVWSANDGLMTALVRK